jgi:hypothetical protein
MGKKLLAAGRAADGSTYSILPIPRLYSQHFIFFITYEGATTLSIMTLGLKTFNIMMKKMRHSA